MELLAKAWKTAAWAPQATTPPHSFRPALPEAEAATAVRRGVTAVLAARAGRACPGQSTKAPTVVMAATHSLAAATAATPVMAVVTLRHGLSVLAMVETAAMAHPA